MWYFGDITALSGITSDAYSRTDFGSSILKFKSGLSAVVDFSWSSYAHRQMHIEIHVEGSNGFMKVTNDYIKLFLKKKVKDFEEGWSTIYSVELYEPAEFLLGVETAYYDEDKHFIDCCKLNKTDLDWNYGLKTQKILESILESNKNVKPYVWMIFMSNEIDKVILGANPFEGVSYLSQEQRTEYRENLAMLIKSLRS